MVSEVFGSDGMIEMLSIVIYLVGLALFVQACIYLVRNSGAPGARQFGVSVLVFLALAIVSVFLEDSSEEMDVLVALMDCIGSVFFVVAALGLKKFAASRHQSS